MSGTEKPRLLIFIIAYFAERTIEKVLRRIPASLQDKFDVEILVIDDSSKDQTFAMARQMSAQQVIPFKMTVLWNPVNQGYGGNQKIGYHYAIEKGFDFVALIHGDGQYAPECLPELLEPLRLNEADAVLGSRMMHPLDALKGGMPLYKFVGNRVSTTIQNWLLDMRMSEFHSGYRIYATAALRTIPFERNSNGFDFDTEMTIELDLAQQRIKEIPIPTYYGDEVSYLNGIPVIYACLKSSLQARLQRSYLFYDRRFDCAPRTEGGKYPSKLDFDSSHSRILELVPDKARVLDLGSGIGAVGDALKKKGCHVVGCDLERGPLTASFDRFVVADLDRGMPDFDDETFDYILALDVVEHLRAPDEFLDRLRAYAARSPNVQVILTTANVGFIVMRLLLLMGRFEYGLRGILDLTHTRLFTMATLRRALVGAGFELKTSEGIVVPIPFLLGDSWLSRSMMKLNRILARILPTLFGFQILIVATPRPTLATLLSAAEAAAAQQAAADVREPVGLAG